MKERRKTFVAILVLGLLLTPVAGIGQAQEARPAMPDTQAERTQSATDLLIITPRAFETVLAPLVDHKTATGISTVMITLEDVYRTGSGDEAERVKQAICAYYDSSSVKYVMLVGDVDRFPVRWVTAVRGTETEYFFPSDLYYADLYNADETPATWDYDADDLYGEHRCAPDASDANLDRLDLHPEVAVGRVPASTVEEVESYVAKIIRYEHLTYDADWFRNVLLIAGGGRTKSRWCDPGINFAEVQGHLGSAFGDTFTYRTWMYEKYYLDTGEETGRPCVCEAFEPLFMCLTRTRLPDTASVAVFENAGRWGPNLPNLAAPIAEFEDVGFLGWHDHTSSIRDYTRDVDNTDRFSVAFADGCGDGAFAGPDIGSVSRFAEPYLTADGHALQVLFSDVVLDTDGDGVNETYYHATGCALDGSPPVALDGAHCSGGIYPGMVIADDFGLDPSAAAPVPRTSPYVLNSPSPAPLQLCDWEWNPESKLFAKREATGKETGWISMVGATKGVQFPHNGELLELFFEGYAVPHSSVAGRRRMGDAWRSMMERWLDIVFDASGDFGMDHIYDVYHIAPSEIPCAGYAGMQHAMMYALFGDPSLRIGGIDLPADILPPTTTDDTDGAWHSEPVEVTLTAADAGSPPSGVRTTTYSVLGGGGERVGTHFTISAPSDHSNDGIHEIKYFSVDFLENAETMNLAEVKIDTVAPETKAYLDGAPVHASAGSDTALPVIGFPMEITEAGQQGVLFYPSESIPTDRGCYNVSVDVTLAAVDDVSDVASTWFWVDRSTRLPELYHGSFSIHAGDYVTPVVLEFWSEDNAGNVERARVIRVCVTDYRAGLIKDSVRVLAALEEIIAMQMRQDLASTLPPIKAVGFDYQFKGEPGSPWTAIGLDENGKDGWRVDWKTTEVENGDYGLRMTAWGFPQTQAGEPQAEDPLVYQEEVGVTVSNIPNGAYGFDLVAWPDTVDRGQTVEYTLNLRNNTGDTLEGLAITCDLDPGLFETVEVLDGGELDPFGLPTWSVAKVQPNEELILHFHAKTQTDLFPGTTIASQAFLTADKVPLLLSDDPSTPNVSAPRQEGADWTAVTVNLVNGSIAGRITDAVSGTPISASVSIAGPVLRVITTDATGHYAAADLPPGAYSVSVAAIAYAYHTPTGPATVTLDGTVASTQVNFQLAPADIMPPVSEIQRSADEIVLSSAAVVTGTAYDYIPGSGVAKVELSILRAADDTYWDGAGWAADETWLLASGTTLWTLDYGSITWGDPPYTMRSRATDSAGNVETPRGSETTRDLPAPELTAPADGSLVGGRPTFNWSLVIDSRYRLQVDSHNDFRSPVIDAQEIHHNVYTPPRLAGGTYYWRVQAADPDLGYPESDWSDVWTVTVITPIYLPLAVRDSAP